MHVHCTVGSVIGVVIARVYRYLAWGSITQECSMPSDIRVQRWIYYKLLILYFTAY